MSEMNPEPRQPEEIYRRRRLVFGIGALIVLALIVGLIVLLVSALAGKSEPTATASPTPTVTPTVTVTPSPTATETPEAQGCAPEAVKVTAEVNQESYAPGENPVFTLNVENSGEEDCELNLGTTQQEFLVKKGEERVFSTVDCQADPQDLNQIIKAKESESAEFTWERNRTAPECPGIDEGADPGEYTLQVKLGEATSEPVPFTLTE